MPYHWKKKIDVDETIVVVKSVLTAEKELPNWLVNTIYGAIRDSDPAMVKYFYAEVKKYAPATMKYFEEGSTRSPISQPSPFSPNNQLPRLPRACSGNRFQITL